MTQKKWAQFGLSLLIKVSILAIAVYFIYSKYSEKEFDLSLVYAPKNLGIILPSYLFLWVLNLYLDAQIWRKAQSMLEPITQARAFKINFICYALLFITPVQSGDLIGRYIMLVEKDNRKKAVFLTFWSYLPRAVGRTLVGVIFLAIILVHLQLAPSTIVYPFAILAIVLMFALLFSFRNIQKWLASKSLGKLNFGKHLMADRPTNTEKASMTFLGFARYLAFNGQFALLLMLWSPESLSLWTFAMVPVYFFITGVLPSFMMFDFLIKSAIAFWIFAPILDNNALLLTSSFALWVTNLVVPAIIGTYFIMKTNILKSLKTKFSSDSPYTP